MSEMINEEDNNKFKVKLLRWCDARLVWLSLQSRFVWIFSQNKLKFSSSLKIIMKTDFTSCKFWKWKCLLYLSHTWLQLSMHDLLSSFHVHKWVRLKLAYVIVKLNFIQFYCCFEYLFTKVPRKLFSVTPPLPENLHAQRIVSISIF